MDFSSIKCIFQMVLPLLFVMGRKKHMWARHLKNVLFADRLHGYTVIRWRLDHIDKANMRTLI